MVFRKQPWHKVFKKKSFEEANESRKKFQSGRGTLRSQKDEWEAEWKRDNAHRKFCWSCGVRSDGNPENTTTMMHALKQRFITTREDCRRAAWVCWREHRSYDEAQGTDVHAKMAEFVDGLIKKMG
jgi:hypothetical protein